jgi:hypothetical protein
MNEPVMTGLEQLEAVRAMQREINKAMRPLVNQLLQTDQFLMPAIRISINEDGSPRFDVVTLRSEEKTWPNL